MTKQSNEFNNVTILINSCIAFSDMWNNVSFLFDKYWPNHPKAYILTDKDDPSFKMDKIVIDKEMSTRLLESLDKIDTKYVFLTFDDYYLKKPVNEKTILSLIKEMDNKDIDYCRIFYKLKTKGKKDKNLKYKYLPLKDTYEVNFYPSIWKKEALKKVLKKDEVIWKLEARITKRAREENLKCIYVNNKGIFDFVDVVRKGKYLRSAYRYLKRNSLYISSRKKRTIRETIKLNTQIFVSEHAPKRIKKCIKNRMHKKGKVYYSDYENTDD